jgi:predicted DsbA family dithiol-disulfide isomerase
MLGHDDPAWTGYWDSMAEEGMAEGLTMVRPPLVPWTRKAHELALLAREKGCFDKVHQALFRIFHLEGRDIGRVDVLVSLGRDAGLDLTETKAVLDIDRLAPDLEAVRAEGEALGVRGAPSLVLGEELVEGVLSTSELKTIFGGN